MRESQPTPDLTPALIAWAARNPAIRAMLLTSTRAIPNATTDALSDYDVILVAEDIQPFVADRTWINDFGTVLVVYWDPVYPDPDTGLERFGNVTQYADGLKIDFSVWPCELLRRIVVAPSLPAELDVGYRVLLDKDGLCAGLLPPTGMAYVPRPPSLSAYLTLINDFLSSAPYVAKCLWRDELLPAKWCLDFDMKHPFLRQMLEWRMAMDHGWSVPAGNLGKGLKKHLPPDIWQQLTQTFVGPDIADNWAALRDTLALFRRVACEVGAPLGYTYPEDLHERVCDYVERIKHMARLSPAAYMLSIEDPDSPDAVALLEVLSDTLSAITGASGRASFQAEDVRTPRGCFVVARLPDGRPVGCGALRPLDGDIAEIKRMYAQPGTVQLGRQILAFLEAQAKGFGYTAIWLETRLINTRAVQFYERQGYRRIPNYGRYVGRPEAVCFAKDLGSA